MSGSASLKKSNSGPLNRHGDPVKKSSDPQSSGVTPSGRQNSGPIPVLPTTGLIMSGCISSGPLNSSEAPRKVSDPLESMGSMKVKGSFVVHDQAVNVLSQDVNFSFKRNFTKLILWALILLFVMDFIAGGFILGVVQYAILLVVVVLFCTVAALFAWNSCWGRTAIMGFIACYPDAGLRNRHAVDFYISDFQSGLTALVKTGYDASVTPFVVDLIGVDVNPANEALSPEFIRWLGERNLSSDDRVMRIKEGYIKEGSMVSVMGVVQRNDNVLMIVPPPEPITTGCQWGKCIFPASLEGIVLRCEDTSNNDAIPV